MRAIALIVVAVLGVAVPVASAVPASAAAAPDVCGGSISDYVGATTPDAAFTGFLDDHGVRTPFTVTPTDVAGTVQVEIKPTVVEGKAVVEQAWDGSPMIVVDTPRGHAESDALECATPGSTRVNRIYGTVLVGGDHLEMFVLMRA